METSTTILLPDLNAELNRKVQDKGFRKSFGPNQQIFAEGETASFLPIVLTGQVKLVRYPEAGREVILGVFSPGEIFAIPPALDGKQFPATAVSIKESQLLLIPRDDFLGLMQTSIEFSAAIVNRMCGLLRARAETVQILATPSAEHRVAGVILQLAGEANGEKATRITHRRQDIAEMAGLTLETTIRSIRKLADRGYLRIVRGKIVLDTTEHLKEFVR
jgi:CRP/FNR family cyclic AMP-dependent transcriptional regulator